MQFLKWGSGHQHVVCLHGWPGEGAKWSELASHLSNPQTTIWAPDLPGWGGTPLESDMTLQDYADAVKQFLDQHQISRPIIIGHSFGGRVAVKFANLFPEDLSKLILIASAGVVNRSWHVKARIWLSNKVPGLIKNYFHPWIGSFDYRHASRFKRQTFKNIVNEDLQAAAATITSPTLIIWGEQDHTTPISYGQLFHQLIRNSKSFPEIMVYHIKTLTQLHPWFQCLSMKAPHHH